MEETAKIGGNIIYLQICTGMKKWEEFLLREEKSHSWARPTDIEQRLQGYSGFRRPRTQKQMRTNVSTIFAHRAGFHACLSSRSDPNTYATNESSLIVVKTRIPPIGAPCWDTDGAGSGISGLYVARPVIKVTGKNGGPSHELTIIHSLFLTDKHLLHP